jgi:nucleoside-diphosphate-sugar epimerase
MASLVYLAAHFLLNRADVLPRSVLLCFLVLVVLGTIGMRALKEWLVRNGASTGLARATERGQSVGDWPILIVGGAGYIGSILCRKLLAQVFRVRVLDSLLYGDSAVRDLYNHPRFELHTGDCWHIQSVVGALAGVKSVVHLAAIVGDPACEQNRQSALEINYAATRMLIEIAKGNHVERLVFASSCSVYGATDLLMDEKSKVQPISLYAETKVDSENALINAGTNEFHPTILRFATVFGHSPRPRFDLVVNLLTAKAYKDRLITIFNGQQWRPFIHVSDVAEGILAALRAPIALVSHQIFNVGDSRLNHTLSEIAEKVQMAFPDTQIENVENSDRRNYRVSFEKIHRELGFQCTTTLDEGIREMQKAFEDQTVTDHTDIRYHNQRYLDQKGSPLNQGPLDAQVMAAFACSLESFENIRVPAQAGVK